MSPVLEEKQHKYSYTTRQPVWLSLTATPSDVIVLLMTITLFSAALIVELVDFSGLVR